MTRHIGMIVLAALIVVTLLASTVFFKVSRTQMAVVKTFGATTEVINGQDNAGLHVKWPWPIQQLVMYDGWINVFENPYVQLLTADKQSVLVGMYCAWRITDPATFNARLQIANRGQELLRTFLGTAENDVFGNRNMEELVNADPNKMLIPQIEQAILDPVRAKARDYGIDVVTVGIKSLGLPEDVTKSVIESMKAERKREVASYQGAGESQAKTIESRANLAAKQIQEFAMAKAAKIRAEGILAAAEQYQLFNENPELAMYLRALESLRIGIGQQSTIILDGRELPAVKFLQGGPSLNLTPSTMPSTMPAEPSVSKAGK